MGNAVEWSKKELELIGGQDDEMQQMINKNILEIVEVFYGQGHSGFSANYTLNIITRLLDWKPITPLTGEDSEWEDVSHLCDGENLQQNSRYYSVFRKNNDNSTAYCVDGKVFSDDGGETWYTCSDSRVPVTFPYVVPEKPEYVILSGKEDEMG